MTKMSQVYYNIRRRQDTPMTPRSFFTGRSVSNPRPARYARTTKASDSSGSGAM